MEKLKVGVFFADSSIECGGTFIYANGLINMLLKDPRVEKLVIFYSKEQLEYIRKLANTAEKVVLVLVNVRGSKINNVFYKICNLCDIVSEIFPIRRLENILKKVTCWISPYRRIFERAGIDIIHVPSQTAPVYGIKCPVVITMHDMQELHYPEFFTAQERVFRAVHYKRSIEQSDLVVVSVEQIKNDVLKYFKVPSSKVHVCPLPFAEEWFQDSRWTKAEELRGKYNLFNRFILYPAMTWEHKNHLRLIKSLYLLKQQGITVHLVCTGKKTDHYFQIEKEIRNLGLDQQVSFLGLVPEDDLIGLYKITDLVVIPTLYEAESQPFFEAMRYEVPVICSNVTSLPESMGQKEFVFNPYNEQEMAELVRKGIFDAEFRQRNIVNLRQRKLYYQSIHSADNFLNAYFYVKSHFAW